MRKVINKMVTEEDLIRTVAAAYSHGWRQVKLYFMVGLPTETDEDVLQIADLAQQGDRQGPRGLRAQRHPVHGLDRRLRAQAAHAVPVGRAARPRDHRRRGSRSCATRSARTRSTAAPSASATTTASPGIIEGLLSRGDRRVGAVIEQVWRDGGRFDGWSEHFSYDRWVDARRATALAGTGVDLDWFTTREREYDEVLPWDHLDSGPRQGLALGRLGGRHRPVHRRRGRGLPLDALLRLRRLPGDGHRDPDRSHRQDSCCRSASSERCPRRYVSPSPADPVDVAAIARLRHAWTSEQAGEAVEDGSYEERFAAWFERERHQRRTWLGRVDGEPVAMLNLLVFTRHARARATGEPLRPPGELLRVPPTATPASDLPAGRCTAWADARDLVRIVLSPSERSVPAYLRAGFAPATSLLVPARPPLTGQWGTPRALTGRWTGTHTLTRVPGPPGRRVQSAWECPVERVSEGPQVPGQRWASARGSVRPRPAGSWSSMYAGRRDVQPDRDLGQHQRGEQDQRRGPAAGGVVASRRPRTGRRRDQVAERLGQARQGGGAVRACGRAARSGSARSGRSTAPTPISSAHGIARSCGAIIRPT